MCKTVAEVLKKHLIESTILEAGDKRLLGHTGHVFFPQFSSIFVANLLVIEFMGENRT